MLVESVHWSVTCHNTLLSRSWGDLVEQAKQVPSTDVEIMYSSSILHQLLPNFVRSAEALPSA